jgi:hypothetical protein
VRSTLPSRSTSASAADVHRRSAVAARAFSTARLALSSPEKRKCLRLSSGDEGRLAGQGIPCSTFLAMPVRSLERLTPQELIYLASGARLLARQAKEGAGQQESPSVRQTFQDAEQRLPGSCSEVRAIGRREPLTLRMTFMLTLRTAVDREVAQASTICV